MRAVFDFIVKPIGDRYTNKVSVGDKELITNTRIDNFKQVNNVAEVIAIPLAIKTNIKVGDKIIIHHNIFRRFHDIKGVQKNSRSYFKEDMYFVSLDQIYLYGDFNKWESINDRCFIKPIKNIDSFKLDKERKLIGILKYGNNSLNALNISPGDIVGYTPNGEYEFIIDSQRLYCMKSNDIVIKYEYKGDETEYNPSWAQGGS
jgi:co-chaperonin GroES (HSP10)